MFTLLYGPSYFFCQTCFIIVFETPNLFHNLVWNVEFRFWTRLGRSSKPDGKNPRTWTKWFRCTKTTWQTLKRAPSWPRGARRETFFAILSTLWVPTLGVHFLNWFNMIIMIHLFVFYQMLKLLKKKNKCVHLFGWLYFMLDMTSCHTAMLRVARGSWRASPRCWVWPWSSARCKTRSRVKMVTSLVINDFFLFSYNLSLTGRLEKICCYRR